MLRSFQPRIHTDIHGCRSRLPISFQDNWLRGGSGDWAIAIELGPRVTVTWAVQSAVLPESAGN